jgi:transcriptional regulator with XRE-family HTH domain
MRMRQPTTGLRDARLGPSPARVVGNGLGEPAVSGRDPQLGHIFRNMRAAMRLSREALARRLATTPGTVEDFETGTISNLPHWRETTRIVRGYCETLRLDPDPILWRIQNHLRAGGQADSPTRAADVRPPSPPPAVLRKGHARSEGDWGRSARRKGRRVLRLFAVSTPLALAAAAVYFANTAPAPVYRAIAQLPAPLSATARAGLDQLLLISAPRRDGLRWIDVGDPKLRKVDKLQTSKL